MNGTRWLNQINVGLCGEAGVDRVLVWLVNAEAAWAERLAVEASPRRWFPYPAKPDADLEDKVINIDTVVVC